MLPPRVLPLAIMNIDEMGRRAGVSCVHFEVVYQLRWMCAATLSSILLPMEIQANDLRHLLPEHLVIEVADLRISHNGLQVPPWDLLQLEHGDKLQILVWDSAMWRNFGRRIDRGMADVDVAYAIEPQHLLLEITYMSEGEAAVLLPSSGNVMAATRHDTFILEIYHHEAWVKSWAQERWPLLQVSQNWNLLEAHASTSFSWLLGRFEKVLLVELTPPALRPHLVVVEFDDGINPRAIGTHIHVIFSPGWVNKQFFLQRWFNGPFLQLATRQSHLSLNGQWVTSAFFSVHKGDFIYVEVVDREAVHENKRRRSCLAEPGDYASHFQLRKEDPLGGRQTTGSGGSHPVASEEGALKKPEKYSGSLADRHQEEDDGSFLMQYMPEIPEDLPSTMESATMMISTLSQPPQLEGYHRYEFSGMHAFEQARAFVDEYRMNTPWYGAAVSVALHVLVSTVWSTRSLDLQCPLNALQTQDLFYAWCREACPGIHRHHSNPTRNLAKCAIAPFD